MEYLIKFQLNIYALIILIVLFGTVKIRNKFNSFAKKLFKTAVIFSSIALIVEPLTWIFDSKTFFGAYFLEYFTNFVLVLLGPIICGLMISYVDYYIHKKKERIIKKHYYQLPSLLTIIMLIINIFIPIYFDVNADNSYIVKELYWIHFVLIILLYLYMLIITILHHNKIFRHVKVIFICFFILPIIGMVIQTFVIDLFFSWSSISLSLLVVYIFLESSGGDKDYLTKLYSRQTYEKYVINLIESKKQFGVVLIDLDNFKEINDQLGHLKGDSLLFEFSRILECCFCPNEMITRLAGDEFLIVYENNEDVDDYLENVRKALKENKVTEGIPIDFSYGYLQYEEGMDMDDLYMNIDQLMYEDKQNKRVSL